jgi:hypothetical protein
VNLTKKGVNLKFPKLNTQFLEILQNPLQTTPKIEESANIFLSKSLSQESASREALESRQRSRKSRKEFCLIDLMLRAPPAADARENTEEQWRSWVCAV